VRVSCCATTASTTTAIYRTWRDTERTLKKHREKVENAAREADYIRSSVEELEALSPQDGEEDDLAERRSRMMKAERIAGDISEASEFLNGNASPVPHIASLVRRLERKSHEAPGLLEETVALLDAALDQLSNAQMEVEAALRKTEYDPKERERVEERLFALRAASRKYSVPVTGLPALAERMIVELADLDAGEERLARLEAELAIAKAAFDIAARSLSDKRHHAGEALASAVMAELPALKLERARFMVEISSSEESATTDGMDTVEFHVQTNPGTRPGSIMKVASGGELSRFLLALKVALADRGSAPTLVFDEIDTGVGGAVADAIGQRLKRLSERVQVLSVTHAPQVAARAATHLLISKGPSSDGSEKIFTRVAAMAPKDRTEEIARMLAGASVTDEARAAAARLLAGNG
jgi:DNA repair protein RecN (Recombination protein N)